MKHYVAAILIAGASLLTLHNFASAHAQLDRCAPAPGTNGTLCSGVGEVVVPAYAPAPVLQATESPVASTPTPATEATGTVAPTAAATVAATPTPAPAASSTTSSSSIPVVIVAGLLEAAIIIGILAFLFRRTPS